MTTLVLTDCPEEAVIRAFLMGQLPREADALMTMHVATCHSCQRLMLRVDTETDRQVEAWGARVAIGLLLVAFAFLVLS